MSPNRLRPRVHMTLSQECIDRIDAIAALSGESRSACVERVFMRSVEPNPSMIPTRFLRTTIDGMTGKLAADMSRTIGDAVKRIGKKEPK